MDDNDGDKKKPHRERHSGRKAEKKKAKNPHVQEFTDKQRNPKAFAINSAVRAERTFRRTQDIKRKKEHIPVIDRTPLEPPPIIVALVGPPKVGKSLVLKCLIKSYTRQAVSSIKGPVTLVSGKKRRITFIECNNDINSMVDIAKVADLVLILIDASFGFEMEIFEFLNICQVHGMPKIMGVLTHLDAIKKTKLAQKTKKILKHRFWKEVYPGAKLFYLSNLQNGNYLKNEIKNLARFISVMKFRPLTWQSSHSYVIADRMEDVTPSEQILRNSKVDRLVCLYGYMRGIPMNRNSFVHIPGCGDYQVNRIDFLSDPCPLPGQIKKRSLTDKERTVYAPFSGVGGIIYDKDAVYIDMPEEPKSAKYEPQNELISHLLKTKETIDTKLDHRSMIQIFSETEPVSAQDLEEALKEEDKIKIDTINENDKRQFETHVDKNDGRKRRKVLFDESDSDIEFNDVDDDELLKLKEEKKSSEGNSRIHNLIARPEQHKSLRDKMNEALSLAAGDSSSDSDECGEDDNGDSHTKAPWEKMDDEEDEVSDDCDNDDCDNDDDSDEGPVNTDLTWKSNLAEKAAKAYYDNQAEMTNLQKLVYGIMEWKDEYEEMPGYGFLGALQKQQQRKAVAKENKDLDDVSWAPTVTRDWSIQSNIDSIRDCFVTGKWEDGEDAEELLKLDDLSESDEELHGDYEDYETGEKHVADEKTNKEKSKEPNREELMKKKMELKEKFDSEYDKKGGDDEDTYFDELKTEANKQAELNRTMFEGIDDEVRVEIEGFRAGLYVRIEIKNMPCEFVNHFDANYPVILGSLQPGEQNIGFIKVHIKKHRWYNKILKTNDPLIISMGWRRFQTIGVYSKQEDNMRHRMLKYTPNHLACMCHFWGPLTKAGTGFLVLKDANGSDQPEPGFRISATGAVVDTNQSTVVTKKLKLIGEPIKIFKKTAFIQGMFTSVLEVAKFEGAKIKTVSGIRGQIKKPISKPIGAFRATFEDKILMSDIVFCRTWYKVDVPQFYTTVSSLLLPPSMKTTWVGMKTLGQLKKEQGIRNKAQEDSMYTDIKREYRPPKRLVIPRAVEKDLPYRYKTKTKQARSKNPGAFMKQVRDVVIRDEYDTKVTSLLRKIKVNYEEKESKVRKETQQRMQCFVKGKQKEKLKKLNKHKELKKNVYRALGKMEADKEKAMKKSKKIRD